MSEYPSAPHSQQTFLRRHSVTSYFVLTFAISWTGAFVVIGPALLHGEPLPKLSRLLVFPVLLLGPCVAGLVLTWIVGGRRQLRNLFSKMCNGRVPVWWYAVLLIPPVLILLTLKCFQIAVSPVFVPNFFIHGAVFGLFAGYLEEIGWTGFAFPMMLKRQSALWSALVLGLLWAIWHLPAVDQLGTATPRTSYRMQYFLVFAITMVAIRVLIAWSYQNTQSVLLAQLMHASSTGSLVVLSPVHASPAQEALWYGAYAFALWIVVAVVVAVWGRNLALRSHFGRNIP